MIGCVRWRQDSNNVKQSKLIQEKKSGGKKIQKKTLKNPKTLKKNKHQTSLNRTRSQKITLGNVCISVAADQKLKYYTDLTTQHNSFIFLLRKKISIYLQLRWVYLQYQLGFKFIKIKNAQCLINFLNSLIWN